MRATGALESDWSKVTLRPYLHKQANQPTTQYPGTMRGLLIVNPNATSTSARARDVLVGALAHQFQLEVKTTEHRGHAAELGAQARADGLDCVIVLGGDGSVNEVVNGMMADGPSGKMPILGVVPGGSANIISRTLGFPNDPIEATGELISSLRANRTRTIGLGRANGRWFLANAGLGVDAEIIADMESQREAGKVATPSRYLATSVKRILFETDRKTPKLAAVIPGEPMVKGIYVAIIQNCSPWTFLGGMPVNPSPQADFDTGLDLWALRSMNLATSSIQARRIVTRSGPGRTKNVLAKHDLEEFRIICDPPTTLQVDGEGLGEVAQIGFESVPEALTVYV